MSEPTYDVFISYSHTDQAWVWEWLIPRLKAAGLAVCTDRESFEIGAPSLINMENAVAASRHTLLVLTPAYLASEWTMYEQILTQTQDPVGLRRRTLPVLRETCDLPPRIAMLTCVDLRAGADAEIQMSRLIAAIRGSRTLPELRRIPVGPVAAATEPPAPPAPAPAFDTAMVRQLLLAAFSDEELATFCFDYFRPVYDEFTVGMSRSAKVQRLVEHCERQGQTAELLAHIERLNPYQYDCFHKRIGQGS